jgi:hypothetical protein
LWHLIMCETEVCPDLYCHPECCEASLS